MVPNPTHVRDDRTVWDRLRAVLQGVPGASLEHGAQAGLYLSMQEVVVTVLEIEVLRMERKTALRAWPAGGTTGELVIKG